MVDSVVRTFGEAELGTVGKVDEKKFAVGK